MASQCLQDAVQTPQPGQQRWPGAVPLHPLPTHYPFLHIHTPAALKSFQLLSHSPRGLRTGCSLTGPLHPPSSHLNLALVVLPYLSRPCPDSGKARGYYSFSTRSPTQLSQWDRWGVSLAPPGSLTPGAARGAQSRCIIKLSCTAESLSSPPHCH